MIGSLLLFECSHYTDVCGAVKMFLIGWFLWQSLTTALRSHKVAIVHSEPLILRGNVT